jgi:site-specific recombinase XerD
VTCRNGTIRRSTALELSITEVGAMNRVTSARVTAPRLLDVIPSFERHLRAENKSPRTIQSYTEAVRRLHDFLSGRGMPLEISSITAEHVEAFMADQLERLRPASARVRFASLRMFFAWLSSREEREIERSPMEGLKPPKVPDVPVPVLSAEELRALLRLVDHDGTFLGRRDAALIRTFIDTGARLGSVAALRVVDLDLDVGTVRFTVKGGDERINPIGTKSARALDRYLRARRAHRDADSPTLWLGRSGPMTSFGVAEAVKRRAREAGIGDIHAHQLRHSAAHHLRVAGADDDALLRLMGWRDRSMLHRYGASAGDERARDVHRRLGLGDRL